MRIFDGKVWPMRALLLLVSAIVFLASCANLPQPKDAQETLIVGSFALYFPGGYFDSPHTEIDSQIRLDFHDVSNGGWRSVYVWYGHFWLTVNGSDEYVLESSRANLSTVDARYVFRPRTIRLKIPASPGTVLYLGDIQLAYRLPGNPLTVYPDPDYETVSSLIGWGLLGAVREKFYDVTITQRWSRDSLLSYLKRVDKEGQWLSKDIKNVKLNAPDETPLPAP